MICTCFLHVLSWLTALLFLLRTLIGWMYLSLFSHLPVEKHGGCFHILQIMNKAALNISMQIFVKLYFSILSGKTKECVAGYYSKNMSSFPRIPPNIFQVMVPFCILTIMNKSCCSTSLPQFSTVSVQACGCSNRHTVIAHGCLNWCFPHDTWCRVFFRCLLVICLFPSVRLLRSLAHVFN